MTGVMPEHQGVNLDELVGNERAGTESWTRSTSS